jgi:ATP-dependent Lon protease
VEQDHGRFADLAVSLTNSRTMLEETQAYLNELNIPDRFTKAIAIVKKECEIIKMQKDIVKQVEERFSKDQRRYLLNEQLKLIQRELGVAKDEKGAVIKKFLDRFELVKCASGHTHCACDVGLRFVCERMSKPRVCSDVCVMQQVHA